MYLCFIVIQLPLKQTKMKTATPSELRQILWDNEHYFGSLNHVQKSNENLRTELLYMPACTLHYVITGDCLMIFSKPNLQ